MKKTISAAIFALALTVSVAASAEGYMFTKTLKVGSRGADVTALQTMLGVSPATGYFGSITKAAVIAYQASHNVSPTSGLVGPLTRAVLNSASNTTTTNTTTTTTTSTTGVGQEGFAEVRVAPTPTSNFNVQTSTNVPVYGIEFKAKQSDISVERVNLQVSVYNAGYENPSTLINSVSVLDGSTVLQTIPVNSSTFSKITSSATTTYYLQVAGLGVKVMKDSTKTLTFTFNTNSIDSNRDVVVSVYGGATGQGIRTVDTRGISSYVGLGDSRSHTFKKPGTSTLTAKDDATTVYSTNYRVRTTGSGAEKVLTSTFALKSETGPSKITGVSVLIPTSASGTLPSTLYLYDGSTLIDARSVTASSSTADGYVVFDLNSSNTTVDTDVTKTFTIKADLPSTTYEGTLVATQVYSVTYEKPNGSAETVVSTGIPGTAVYHYFAAIVPQFGRVSSTATAIRNGTQNFPVSSIEAKFALTLTAQGGAINAGTTGQGAPKAVISLRNASTGAVIATTSAVAIDDESGLSLYSEGAVKGITFQAGFGTSTLTSGSAYKATIDSIAYRVQGASATTTLTAGFQALDTTTVTY